MAGRFWVEVAGQGGLVAPDAARVGVLDHGFTVGDGVFETVLVRGGSPFALTRHLARLARSCVGLGISAPLATHVREAVEHVVGDVAHPTKTHRLRITVSSGAGPSGSNRGEDPSTLVVTCVPASPWPSTTTIATVPWPRNERSATASLKTTSYADNVIALAHAQRVGASEAVMGNTRGELCEGTGSNVFVVVGGVVSTPPLDSGCLPGVTRDLLLEWAASGGVGIVEETLPYDALATADEVFITSSTRDVHPVVRVDERDLSAGPVTERLRVLFERHAAESRDP